MKITITITETELAALRQYLIATVIGGATTSLESLCLANVHRRILAAAPAALKEPAHHRD